MCQLCTNRMFDFASATLVAETGIAGAVATTRGGRNGVAAGNVIGAAVGGVVAAAGGIADNSDEDD